MIIKNKGKIAVFIADCISIIFAIYIALLFRFDFNLNQQLIENYAFAVLILLPLKIILFYIFGFYRGMWRYTGINDLKNLVKANATALVIVFASLVLINRFQGLSRSVFLMDGILCFLFTASTRLLIRLYYSSSKDNKETIHKKIRFKRRGEVKRNKKKTLIVGSGDQAEKLAREILNNDLLNIKLIGYLDDDINKKGYYINGVPILGHIKELSKIIRKFNIEAVFVAKQRVEGQQMRKIVSKCEELNVEYKTLPSMGEIITGTISIKDLRDVNYEDLLGRKPVKIETDIVKKYIDGKRVLVTGAGGSIGSELCRQIVRYNPRKIVLMDNNEFNLFNIVEELRTITNTENKYYMGRVQDKQLASRVYKNEKPNIVFHAAAYKHVHLVEKFPWEGVYNNILGSKVQMDEAKKNMVDSFVLVSTDKAVNPSSVMGACKRISEILASINNNDITNFSTVRFGNVIGSSGSVMPYFRKQIKKGGPVTVTHPEATRYFMTIEEACKLILQAGSIGKGGEIFVLEMGTPVKILTMAEDLIKLSGKVPYEEIKIIITGLREGEKVFEELNHDMENILPTGYNKINVLRQHENWETNKEKMEYCEKINNIIESIYVAASKHDIVGIKNGIKKILNEYKYEKVGTDNSI